MSSPVQAHQGAARPAKPETRWRPLDTRRWLVGPVPVQAPRFRLLCVPHAGGAPSAYRPWASLLPPDTELVVAQLPGRESRYGEPALEQVAPVVTALSEALQTLPPLPLVLFGHSMGALIAYELAQALRARHLPAPALLAVSGHGSPLNPDHYTRLLDVDTEDFVAEVSRRYGGIPAPILADPTLLQFFLPLLRADFSLVANYRAGPRPALDCPLLVLGGEADPHVGTPALEEWRACTSNQCSVRLFPGGHFYLAEQASEVLEALWSSLPPSFA